jgi:hypothetical protein
MNDDELLNKYGWIITCESPFEIEYESTRDSATREAAVIILDYYRKLDNRKKRK